MASSLGQGGEGTPSLAGQQLLTLALPPSALFVHYTLISAVEERPSSLLGGHRARHSCQRWGAGTLPHGLPHHLQEALWCPVTYGHTAGATAPTPASSLPTTRGSAPHPAPQTRHQAGLSSGARMVRARRSRKRRQQAYLQHGQMGLLQALGDFGKVVLERSYCHLVDDAGDAAQGPAGQDTPHGGLSAPKAGTDSALDPRCPTESRAMLSVLVATRKSKRN